MGYHDNEPKNKRTAIDNPSLSPGKLERKFEEVNIHPGYWNKPRIVNTRGEPTGLPDILNPALHLQLEHGPKQPRIGKLKPLQWTVLARGFIDMALPPQGHRARSRSRSPIHRDRRDSRDRYRTKDEPGHFRDYQRSRSRARSPSRARDVHKKRPVDRSASLQRAEEHGEVLPPKKENPFKKRGQLEQARAQLSSKDKRTRVMASRHVCARVIYNCIGDYYALKLNHASTAALIPDKRNASPMAKSKDCRAQDHMKPCPPFFKRLNEQPAALCPLQVQPTPIHKVKRSWAHGSDYVGGKRVRFAANPTPGNGGSGSGSCRHQKLHLHYSKRRRGGHTEQTSCHHGNDQK